jgi:hypothetical protein
MWVSAFGWSLVTVGYSFALRPGLRSLRFLVVDSNMEQRPYAPFGGMQERVADVCPFID